MVSQPVAQALHLAPSSWAQWYIGAATQPGSVPAVARGVAVSNEEQAHLAS
jgi:hypothetical protein